MERREKWELATGTPGVRSPLARRRTGFTGTGTGSRRRPMPPPTGMVTVIANPGAPFGGLTGSIVAGIEDVSSPVDCDGPMPGLDEKLTPLAAEAPLGLPLNEITGRTVAAEEIFGAAAARPAEAWPEEPGWTRRLVLADAFPLRRTATGPRSAGEAAWARRRLMESGGRTPIGALAEEVGRNRRIARFAQQTGLPAPRRIIGFTGPARRLDRARPLRWDRPAVGCGYYDCGYDDRPIRTATS